MKTIWIAPVALAAALAAAMPAQAQEKGNFIVRARAVHLDSADKDSTGLGLTINNKTIPEVDISMFITPSLAAELILTYPQKQTVSVGGAAIGTFKHLPPTLTLQYRPFPDAAIQPYVGAGVNLTYTMNNNMTALGKRVTLDAYSLKPALQVGVDIPVDKKWSINVDVKKIWLGSDVYLDGTKISHVKLDPLAISIGVGYRF